MHHNTTICGTILPSTSNIRVMWLLYDHFLNKWIGRKGPVHSSALVPALVCVISPNEFNLKQNIILNLRNHTNQKET